jgi:hypothetical protein
MRDARPVRSFGAAAAAALAACCCVPPLAARAQATDPVQVIAEMTTIQLSCRSLEVRPGVAFRFGESHGVRAVDILPGGRRRGEFEEALAKASMIDPERLCSTVAARYAVDLPGSIGQR